MPLTLLERIARDRRAYQWANRHLWELIELQAEVWLDTLICRLSFDGDFLQVYTILDDD